MSKRRLKLTIDQLMNLIDLPKNLSQSDLDLWKEGVLYEFNYWREFLRTGDYANYEFVSFTDRLNAVELLQRIKNLLKDGDTILDVGSGPVSVLKSPSHKIVKCDPLGNIYNKLLEFYGFNTDTILPYFSENVNEKISEGFDIVHARNSLDHSANPVQAILSMIKTAKSGGLVYLYHHENVAILNKYQGFHQYNFTLDESNKLLISNKAGDCSTEEIFSLGEFQNSYVYEHNEKYIETIIKVY